MKQNKHALIGIVSLLVAAIAITALFIFSTRCVADGDNVCYLRDTETFALEKDAKVLVQVESKGVGEKAVEEWNRVHPEAEGALEYIVREPLSTDELQEPLETDVIVTSLNNAAYFTESFYNMGTKVTREFNARVPNQFQDQINYKGYYFVPNSVSGPLFVYNKTLMEELGYNTEDIENNGLPTAFDSWEKIMDPKHKILDNIDIIYPLTFQDQQSFYPMLTAGRWSLNFSKSGSNPGFDSREFKEGLSFIEWLGTQVLDKTTQVEVIDPEVEAQKEAEAQKSEDQTKAENTEVQSENKEQETQNESQTENKEQDSPKEGQTDDTASDETEVIPEVPKKYRNNAMDLKWQYDTAFFDRRTMFSYMTDYQLADGYQKQTEDEYVYAPFPSYQGHRLTPLADVTGYAASKDIQYPSATAEAIRILRSGPVVSVYYSATLQVPVYHRNYFDELTIDNQDLMNKIRAYNFSIPAPIMALDNNPDMLARSLYKDIDFMPVLSELFDGKISVEEAQTQIKKLSTEWLEKNDIIEEA